MSNGSTGRCVPYCDEDLEEEAADELLAEAEELLVVEREMLEEAGEEKDKEGSEDDEDNDSARRFRSNLTSTWASAAPTLRSRSLQ